MAIGLFAVHPGARPQVFHGAAHATLDVRHPLAIPAAAREVGAAYVKSGHDCNGIDVF